MSRWKILRLHRDDMTVIDAVSRWTFDAWGGLHPPMAFDEWRGETREDCGARGVPSVFVAMNDGNPIATETLNKSTSEMKRKAHGTQNTRHNMGLGECSSTTQRSDSLAQAFMQRLPTASLTASDMSIRPAMGPWLASVFVLPAWRGRGIASALVAAVETEAREAGCQRLYLYTPDQMALYARLGWVPFESVIYRGEDVTLMHRDL